MHEPYEDDEDQYDENDNHEYPYNPYQWYYKFDVDSNSPFSDWINEVVKNFIDPLGKNDWQLTNIDGFPIKKFPVNSWNPSTGNSKFQYLGSNYVGESIWKTQYFLVDKLNSEYKMHLQTHAKHFVQQPCYYNGMFDILN